MFPKLKIWKLFSPWLWLALGLAALLLQQVLVGQPEWVEAWYSRGWFLGVRAVLDHSIGLLPFPVWYVLVGGVAFLAGRALWRWWRRPGGWRRKIGRLLLGVGGVAGAVVFFFFLLWGYNYLRLPLEDLLAIEARPISPEETLEELEWLTAELLAARAELSRDTLPLEQAPRDSRYYRESTRELLRAFLGKADIPAPRSLKARQLQPRGVLLHISTAGVYFPLTGECNVDDGLHPLQLPFVLAHEYGHGYGFGDEGSCNFLAYVACMGSEDPWIRYSGILGYWRYVAGSARRLVPEAYDLFWDNLHQGIKQDLKSIRQQMDRYPDIFPQVRDLMYTTYLKSQGISEGMANYSRVVQLAYAWRRR